MSGIEATESVPVAGKEAAQPVKPKFVDIQDVAEDLEACKAKVRDLQLETIQCVAFKPSGKVEIVEKEHLEELNAEIERIKGFIASNEKVHEALSKLLSETDCFKNSRMKAEPSLWLALSRKSDLEHAIEDAKNRLRTGIANLLKTTYGIDPANPYSHPEGRAIKEDIDARLAALNKQLEAVDELIAKAKEILQGYQPSGVVAAKKEDFGKAISREKMGVLGGAP